MLDANPASVHENRGDVYQWAYNGTIAQKWYYFSDLTIRPAADPLMCLDANPHTPFNGGEVYLWKCGNNLAQQKWTRTGNSGLRSNYSGLCLDVDTSTNFDGGKVQQWSCNAKPQQVWFFHNA